MRSSAALEVLEVESPYVRLPASIWVFFGIGAAVGALMANPWLTAASILVLPVFMSLLWRQGETPVLLFAVGYQWLQVTAKVFHADVLGIPVDDMAESGTVELAIYLGLIGLVVLSLGMRLGMRRLKRVRAVSAMLEAKTLSPDRAFVIYLVGTAFASVVQKFAWIVSGLEQPLLALVVIKWVFFFVLGYVVLYRRERYFYFFTAVAIEFISGIGFFSGFKIVLFVTLLVVFTVRYEIRLGTILSGTFVLAVLILLGAAWTSVKTEYREFLNQDTRRQVTLVSRSEQFGKLAELVGQLQPEDVFYALGPLFERVAYVDYFALTLDYVPRYRPHEEGHVWFNSIRHVFTPRIFFPNKPRLRSDSELTMQYTGLYLASDDQGTSISLGYMVESYIDFGYSGMFFPIFVLGLFWGYMYYYFMTRAKSTLLGFAFATALLLGAYQFEMASIKLLGGIMVKFIVLALVVHFLQDRIALWLHGHPEPAMPPRVIDQAAAA